MIYVYASLSKSIMQNDEGDANDLSHTQTCV